MTKQHVNTREPYRSAEQGTPKASRTRARTTKRNIRGKQSSATSAKGSLAVRATVASASPAGARKRTSKQDQLGAMLIRDEGATISEMMIATGWLAHTVRAALTRLREKGYAIDSDKVDGVRTYRGIAPQ
jgi:uncharacterized protein DUF3489